MNYGLHLLGGGAKGAFQAGVLYGLNERNIKYNVVSGTSIGAINGYFVVKNDFDLLKDFYTKNYDENFMENKISGLVVDNDLIKIKLTEVENKKENIKENSLIEGFYVNYVEVNNGEMTEKIENIIDKPFDYAVDRILWSSRLPYNHEEMTFSEFIEYQNKHDLYSMFKNDITNGVYDGINLDGGMLNNIFIKDILNHKIDKLIVIAFGGNREEYIKNVHFYFGIPYDVLDKIIYVAPKTKFEITDTYQFEKGFLSKKFNEGYELSKEINLK